MSFGFKGSRFGPQDEEEMSKRVDQTEAEYEAKVMAARSTRQELVNSLRPQTVHALQELIHECDSGLTVFIQKYAILTEKVALNNGLTISPFKSDNSAIPSRNRSFRDVIRVIDNEKDFVSYVASYQSKLPPPEQRDPEMQFIRHPTRGSHSYHQVPMNPPPPQIPLGSSGMVQHQQHHDTSSFPMQPGGFGATAIVPAFLPQPILGSQNRPPSSNSMVEFPRNRPSFGVPLDELIERDDVSIPIVVYQCVVGIDKFGLAEEGIYRLSGNKMVIDRLKAIFDNDPTSLDFSRMEDFSHDVNAVTSILKQFFRELPEPLFTRALYPEMIMAASTYPYSGVGGCGGGWAVG
jgi:hypothetical protein